MMADLVSDMSDLDDVIGMIHTEVYFSLTRLCDEEVINTSVC